MFPSELLNQIHVHFEFRQCPEKGKEKELFAQCGIRVANRQGVVIKDGEYNLQTVRAGKQEVMPIVYLDDNSPLARKDEFLKLGGYRLHKLGGS